MRTERGPRALSPQSSVLITLFAILGGAAARRELGHAERQPEAGQHVLDLVERFTAEVLRREHLTLGALHEIAEGADVRVLEAVRGAHGEVELLDRLGEHLGETRIDFRSGGFLTLFEARFERAEDAQVIAEE